MKTDVNGCSTCKAGQENYEFFEMMGKTRCQYDYRKSSGELFSTVADTLEKCRIRRDDWLHALRIEDRTITSYVRHICNDTSND